MGGYNVLDKRQQQAHQLPRSILLLAVPKRCILVALRDRWLRIRRSPVVAMSRDEILGALDHPMTAAQIAKATGGNVGTIRHLLTALRRRGYVTVITGKRHVYQRAV